MPKGREDNTKIFNPIYSIYDNWSVISEDRIF